MKALSLFKGQRKARKSHECDTCGRLVCRGEHYACAVTLHLRGGRDREVTVRRSCCRALRLLVVALLAVAPAVAQEHETFRIEHDDLTHVMLGSTLGWGSREIADQLGAPRWLSVTAAIAVPALVGVVKEVAYDHHADPWDAAGWAIGGGLSVVLEVKL